MTQASSSGTTYLRPVPALTSGLRGFDRALRSPSPSSWGSPPGVPGTRVCLMFYLGGIASQNRIHPTPRSYRDWPGYQGSFISCNARGRPFIPLASRPKIGEQTGQTTETWREIDGVWLPTWYRMIRNDGSTPVETMLRLENIKVEQGAH